MSESKHTPGPWFVTADQFDVVVRPEGSGVPWGKSICSMTFVGEQSEVDARLIAVAPEMLETLERCRIALIDLRDCSLMSMAAAVTRARIQHRIDEIDALIAKAKGTE